MNTGWIVGEYGTILKTTNGGVISVEDEDNDFLQNGFMLYQNYPNPFSTSTTIEYCIPRRDVAELKVFDLFGREVASLVNDEKPAGKHQVQWHNPGVADGVYFYQLKSGEFTLMKKLMVVH
jgi:hypothetical protein